MGVSKPWSGASAACIFLRKQSNKAVVRCKCGLSCTFTSASVSLLSSHAVLRPYNAYVVFLHIFYALTTIPACVYEGRFLFLCVCVNANVCCLFTHLLCSDCNLNMCVCELLFFACVCGLRKDAHIRYGTRMRLESMLAYRPNEQNEIWTRTRESEVTFAEMGIGTPECATSPQQMLVSASANQNSC